MATQKEKEKISRSWDKVGWRPPFITHNKLTNWNWMVSYPSGLKMGKNVDIGAFTYIDAKFGVHISDDVQIGSHCSIYSRNTINNTEGPIILGNSCKIGAHTVILPNTTVGSNKLIKAHSILKGGTY